MGAIISERTILSKKDIDILSQFTDEQILDEMDAYKEKMMVHPLLTQFNLQQMRIFIARRKELTSEDEKEYGT